MSKVRQVISLTGQLRGEVVGKGSGGSHPTKIKLRLACGLEYSNLAMGDSRIMRVRCFVFLGFNWRLLSPNSLRRASQIQGGNER